MLKSSKESLGQYLRRERILREISLEEISRATKIKLNTLKSLESDDYSRLPNITFVRGFIRSYSEYLGLNVPEVMLRFETYIDENPEEFKPGPVVKSSERKVMSYLFFAVLAVLIVVFFFAAGVI